MMKLLKKELFFSSSILSRLFILFGFITLIPNYPILVGAFFVSFGIFHSFQSWRESNDISYSLLLSVAKRDIIKGKFLFVIITEMAGFVIMTICTVIRMTLLKNAGPYATDALMSANLVFLGFALLIFGIFNLIFVSGFFKTSYYLGRPFVTFIIITFIVIGIAETLHHIPGLESLNSHGFENLHVQLPVLLAGIVIFALLTVIAEKKSIESFERTDF